MLIQNPLLPKAIIVDIDGTVAQRGDRDPFDWSKVLEDKPIENVLNIITALSEYYQIIFMTGRDEVCHEATRNWLLHHFDNTDFILFMRSKNDNRQDSIVKLEMFNKFVKDKFYVESVFDDRLSSCRAWHGLGLTLMRVGDPDANF